MRTETKNFNFALKNGFQCIGKRISDVADVAATDADVLAASIVSSTLRVLRELALSKPLHPDDIQVALNVFYKSSGMAEESTRQGSVTVVRRAAK